MSLEVVSQELLVEGRLAVACFIALCRPEAGVVWCQHFVAQDNVSFLVEAEFEFGISDDDASFESIVSALVVKRECQFRQFFHVFFALAREELFDPFHAFFHGNVLVMFTDRSLGGRGEDRLRKSDAADFAVFLISFPAGTCDVSADDAFYRDHVELLCLHGTAFKFFSLEEFRHILCVDGNHVVRNDVLCEIEPEFRHAVQNDALLRDRVFQNVVESGNAVSAGHNEAVAQIIEFTYLAGFEWFVFFHFVFSFGGLH